MDLGALWEAKSHFLRTFCQGEHGGIYRRSKVVLTCQARWPCNLAGRTSLVAPPPFPHWILLLQTYFDMLWKHFLRMRQDLAGRPTKGVGPAIPTLGRLGSSLVPHRPFVSFCPWTPLVLGIIKICMELGPYGAFPSSDVPKMVDQQNSWNLLVISTYLLYLKWNIGMLVVNICILWLPTPSPHTHLEFCSSLSKRKELNHGDISKNSSAIIARE
jgi:hypothetical protein